MFRNAYLTYRPCSLTSSGGGLGAGDADGGFGADAGEAAFLFFSMADIRAAASAAFFLARAVASETGGVSGFLSGLALLRFSTAGLLSKRLRFARLSSSIVSLAAGSGTEEKRRVGEMVKFICSRRRQSEPQSRKEKEKSHRSDNLLASLVPASKVQS